eukprot:6429776-Prymnesium_polylepis.1
MPRVPHLRELLCDARGWHRLRAMLRRPAYVWHISHADWNALMHALHGNTSSDDDSAPPAEPARRAT